MIFGKEKYCPTKYMKNKAEEIYEIFKPMCTNFWCKRDIIAILETVFRAGATEQLKRCEEAVKNYTVWPSIDLHELRKIVLQEVRAAAIKEEKS